MPLDLACPPTERAACCQVPSTRGLKAPRLYPCCPLVAPSPAQSAVTLHVHSRTCCSIPGPLETRSHPGSQA